MAEIESGNEAASCEGCCTMGRDERIAQLETQLRKEQEAGSKLQKDLTCCLKMLVASMEEQPNRETVSITNQNIRSDTDETPEDDKQVSSHSMEEQKRSLEKDATEALLSQYSEVIRQAGPRAVLSSSSRLVHMLQHVLCQAIHQVAVVQDKLHIEQRGVRTYMENFQNLEKVMEEREAQFQREKEALQEEHLHAMKLQRQNLRRRTLKNPLFRNQFHSDTSSSSSSLDEDEFDHKYAQEKQQALEATVDHLTTQLEALSGEKNEANEKLRVERDELEQRMTAKCAQLYERIQALEDINHVGTDRIEALEAEKAKLQNELTSRADTETQLLSELKRVFDRVHVLEQVNEANKELIDRISVAQPAVDTDEDFELEPTNEKEQASTSSNPKNSRKPRNYTFFKSLMTKKKQTHPASLPTPIPSADVTKNKEDDHHDTKVEFEDDVDEFISFQSSPSMLSRQVSYDSMLPARSS